MEYISTSDVPVGQRLRFWEEAVSSLYAKTAVHMRDDREFSGQILWRKIGQVMVSEIVATQQTVSREKHHIQPYDPGLLQINLLLEGVGSIAQDGRIARTEPGHMAIYDSSRPYEMTFEGPFRQFSIDFPRGILHERFGRAQDYTARCISGLDGPGRFLYSFTQSLMDGWTHCDQALSGRLESHLVDLVVTSLCGLAPLSTQKSAHRRITIHRVKNFVNENLREPELSPAMIAEAQGVSLRYLYDLFEDEGITVARYILGSRLDRCKRELEDVHQTARPVAEIAFSWGFNDAAHFSRAFRSRFGMTPRECRAAAVAAQHRAFQSARMVN